MSTINLPKPITSGGKPFLDVISIRKSCKNFGAKPINMDLVSNLLWVAFGINRPDLGKRTAPSARNFQEIVIYVIMADGTYLFDPQKHELNLVVSKDLRTLSSVKENFQQAPLHLAYVADYSQRDLTPDQKKTSEKFSNADAGFIGENVYLYCASVGLGSCFVGIFDESGLGKALNLNADQSLLYTQVVGYPAK